MSCAASKNASKVTFHSQGLCNSFCIPKFVHHSVVVCVSLTLTGRLQNIAALIAAKRICIQCHCSSLDNPPSPSRAVQSKYKPMTATLPPLTVSDLFACSIWRSPLTCALHIHNKNKRPEDSARARPGGFVYTPNTRHDTTTSNIYGLVHTYACA